MADRGMDAEDPQQAGRLAHSPGGTLDGAPSAVVESVAMNSQDAANASMKRFLDLANTMLNEGNDAVAILDGLISAYMHVGVAVVGVSGANTVLQRARAILPIAFADKAAPPAGHA